MEAAQKSWGVDAAGARWMGLRLVIAAIVTAITAAYVVLLFHPHLMREAAPTFSAVGLKPGWALALTAAVAVVGAASLCWLMLAGIARGVQRAPYAWSAPAVLGMCGVALARMPVQLPIPAVPVPLFAACATLLLLVGGALLQLRGWPAKLAGVLILSLPLLSVAGADSLTPQSELAAWAGSAGRGRGFVLVLCGSWLATIALALIARPAPQREDVRPELRDPIGGVEWVPGRTRGDLFFGATTLVMIATLAGAYSWVYLPLVRRVSAQQSMLSEAGAAQRTAIDAQRAQFERELTGLRAKLDAERQAYAARKSAAVGSSNESGPPAAQTVVPSVETLPSGIDVPESAQRAKAERPQRGKGARHGAVRTGPRTLPAYKAAAYRRRDGARNHAAQPSAARRSLANRHALNSPVAADDDPIGGLDSAL